MLHKSYTDEESFQGKSGFISDEAMLEFISNRVSVNADVVFTNTAEKTIYLPTRRFKPAEGIWFIGGGRRAFETAQQTLLRRLQKEASMEDIKPEDFTYVGQIEYIWSYRKEEPTNHGKHDLNDIFSLEVTQNQVDAVASNLDPQEYVAEDGLKSYSSRHDLETAGARQIVLDVYDQLFG